MTKHTVLLFLTTLIKMNAPFSIGQKVVRIGESNLKTKKGEIYIVAALLECPSCKDWKVSMVGHEAESGHGECSCGRRINNKNRYWCRAKLFAPIQTNYADATAEIIEKFKPTEDTPDKIIKPIPIKI